MNKLPHTPTSDTNANSRIGLILMTAVPVGAAIGFLLGGGICLAVLRFEARGQSHADATALAGSCVAGLSMGAVLCPVIAWVLISRIKK